MRQVEAFWDWLGNTELAFQIGATWWFPLLESIHVVAIVTLIASIALVDLRILGKSATAFPIRQITREHLPWVWVAFVVASITGAGLFISRPGAYAANPAFQLKLILLVGAGLNAWLFQRFALRAGSLSNPAPASPDISPDISPDTTVPGRSSTIGDRCLALLSLALWIGVVAAGRWVGHIN